MDAKAQHKEDNQYFTVQYFKNREDMAMDMSEEVVRELTLFAVNYLRPVLEELVGRPGATF